MTNVRGRSNTRTGTTNRSRTNTWKRTNTSSRTGTTNRSTTNYNNRKGCSTTNSPPAYKSCCNQFARKIQSFKMLQNQTTGTAKYTRPSPTTLNTFANWVNKGAVVHTVTPTQVARWAKTTTKTFNTRKGTPTSCKSVLWAKFGKNTIKAVCKTKTGSYMVVTPPTISGRTFNFPK